MRIATILLLLVTLLTAAPLQAQDNLYEACGETETQMLFSVLYGLQQANEGGAERPSTVKGLYAYDLILAPWRKSTRLLASCEEALAVVWKTYRTVDNVLATSVMRINGLGEDEHVYDDRIASSISELETLLRDLEAGAASDEGEKRRRLWEPETPSCSSADLERVLAMTAEHQALLERAGAISSTTDLAHFGTIHMTWRAETWAKVPNCRGPRWHAIFLEQVATDALVKAGLALAGAAADNSFALRLEDTLETLTEFNAEVERRYKLALEEEAFAKPQADELPSCPDDVFQSAYDGLLEYAKQGEIAIESNEDLLRFAERQIAWHADHLTDLPYCAEMLQIRWLLIELNSDFVARAALRLAGVSDEDNPFLRLPSDQARIDAIVQDRQHPNIAQPRSEGAVALPDCSKHDLQIAIDEYLYVYGELEDIRPFVLSIEDTIEYIQALIAWREALWQRMPLCAEAVALGLFMHQFSAGYSPSFTLFHGRIEREKYVYGDQLQLDLSRLEEAAAVVFLAKYES
ncbi:MAG: hypothetical protein OXG60_04275 [Chloroflexi bacterium]|nr:hypothetical protein [Chloroflexota bacterium]